MITARPEASVAAIVALLERTGSSGPIVDNGRIVGIVSRANLLQPLASLKDKTPQARPDDSAIRDKVMAKLRNERWAKPALISVTVQDGAVDLWGIVESETEGCRQSTRARLLAELRHAALGVDHG